MNERVLFYTALGREAGVVCPSPQLGHLDKGMVGRDKNKDRVKEEKETEEVLEGRVESTPIPAPSLSTLR